MEELSRGLVKKNHLVLVYGPEGVGKTTFASGFPDPAFIGSENGSSHLDVKRFPEIKNWNHFMTRLDDIATGKYKDAFKTLVIDSLDWLEPILFESITEGKCPIEDACGSFGKWVGEVNNHYRRVMMRLTKTREFNHVVILAHSQLVKFGDVINNESYDRYQLKLHSQKSSALWKEYVDCMLFINHDVSVKKDKNGQVKTYGEGERIIHTEHRASFDAKNRFNLPSEIVYDLATGTKPFLELSDAYFCDYEVMLKQLLPSLDDDTSAKVMNFIASKPSRAALETAYNKLKQRSKE